MNRLCIFVAMIVFGWIGWWIGAKFGGIAALIAGFFGSALGVYLGWRIARDFLT